MATRSKHLALQNDLKESLTKSRERLARLTSLEQGREEVESDEESNDDDYSNQTDDDEDVSIYQSEEVCKEKQRMGQEGGDRSTENAEAEDLTEKEKERILWARLVDMHSLDTLKEFQKNQSIQRRNVFGLFLPLLGRTSLERIMTLSIREANALDQGSGFKGSPRRCLLWSSCLDFLLLTASVGEKKVRDDKKINDLGTNAATEMVDPNLPFCPYELSGVCADDFCPYQHANRPTLPRERLPLPALSLDSKGKSAESEIVRKKIDVNTDERSSKRAVGERNEETLQSNSEGSDDFITLPNLNSDGSVEEGDQFGDCDDEDDGNANFLVSAYLNGEKEANLRNETEIETKPWSFWWGDNVSIQREQQSIEKLLHDLGCNVIYSELEKPLVQVALPVEEDWTQFLGRIIDFCRIAVHAGRLDIARSLMHVLSKHHMYGQELFQYTIVTKKMVELMKAAFNYDSLPFSFFHSSFCIQASLAVLSEYVRLINRVKQNNTEGWKESTNILQDAAIDCIDKIMDGGADIEKAEVSSVDGLVEDFRTILSKLLADKDVGKSETELALIKLQDLTNAIHWARQTFNAELSPPLKNLDSIEEQVLKPCWAVVSNVTQLISERLHDNGQWEGLTIVILMGYAILGCLERFAAEVNDGEDKLSTANLTSMLDAVGTTIHRILKGMLNQLSEYPMLHLLLAPLHATRVSTAVFLRQYSGAQHHLETCLTLKMRNDTGGPDSSSSPLLGYSELLWCQLLHLRMCLPTETASNETKMFEWELSRESRVDITLLLDKLAALGIRLHHITLEGDWNLVLQVKNDQSSAQESKKDRESISLSLLASALVTDHETTKSISLQKHLLHRCDRGRIPSPLICPLPRSLLLSGNALRFLSLKKCKLPSLPHSFGLYFPNLIVRPRMSESSLFLLLLFF